MNAVVKTLVIEKGLLSLTKTSLLEKERELSSKMIDKKTELDVQPARPLAPKSH